MYLWEFLGCDYVITRDLFTCLQGERREYSLVWRTVCDAAVRSASGRLGASRNGRGGRDEPLGGRTGLPHDSLAIRCTDVHPHDDNNPSGRPILGSSEEEVGTWPESI